MKFPISISIAQNAQKTKRLINHNLNYAFWWVFPSSRFFPIQSVNIFPWMIIFHFSWSHISWLPNDTFLCFSYFHHFTAFQPPATENFNTHTSIKMHFLNLEKIPQEWRKIMKVLKIFQSFSFSSFYFSFSRLLFSPPPLVSISIAQILFPEKSILYEALPSCSFFRVGGFSGKFWWIQEFELCMIET